MEERCIHKCIGAVLWSNPVAAPIAGGAAVVGDDLFAVAGLREPGVDGTSENAGVYRFSLGDGGETPTDDTAPARGGDSGIVGLDPATAQCVDAACLMEFGVNEAPAGPEPRFELRIQPDPLQISVEAINAGDPADWLRPGSEAHAAGASIFGLLISAADDDPFGAGGLICSFGPDETGCTGDQIPRFAPTFNRISLAALSSATAPLTVAAGADRLVRTISFTPALRSVTE